MVGEELEVAAATIKVTEKLHSRAGTPWFRQAPDAVAVADALPETPDVVVWNGAVGSTAVEIGLVVAFVPVSRLTELDKDDALSLSVTVKLHRRPGTPLLMHEPVFVVACAATLLVVELVKGAARSTAVDTGLPDAPETSVPTGTVVAGTGLTTMVLRTTAVLVAVTTEDVLLAEGSSTETALTTAVVDDFEFDDGATVVVSAE